MRTSPIGGLSSAYLAPDLASTRSRSAIGTTPAPRSDSTQLSPFAQLVATLQQLQQTDPTRYAQLTAQIAANLTNAAQTATSQGNTATELSQLASDFSTASTSGQLPNLQDLAQAIGGGQTNSAPQAAAAAASASSTSSAAGSSIGQLLSQLLSNLFGSNQSSPDTAIIPGAVILNTLSNAGISVLG